MQAVVDTIKEARVLCSYVVLLQLRLLTSCMVWLVAIAIPLTLLSSHAILTTTVLSLLRI